MLLPKRVKYRKQFRGRMKGKAHRGNTLSHGEFGLVALEPAWITNRQIEAARIAMTRYIKRGGQVWIKIFPDKPVTAKPAETRMGSGKGFAGVLGSCREAGPRALRDGWCFQGNRYGSNASRRPQAPDQDEVRCEGRQ